MHDSDPDNRQRPSAYIFVLMRVLICVLTWALTCGPHICIPACTTLLQISDSGQISVVWFNKKSHLIKSNCIIS